MIYYIFFIQQLSTINFDGALKILKSNQIITSIYMYKKYEAYISFSTIKTSFKKNSEMYSSINDFLLPLKQISLFTDNIESFFLRQC